MGAGLSNFFGAALRQFRQPRNAEQGSRGVSGTSASADATRRWKDPAASAAPFELECAGLNYTCTVSREAWPTLGPLVLRG